MTARTLTCRVAEVEDLTPDVFRVYLEGRAEAVAHAAGQYLELDIGEGEWVPFSIANAHGGDGRIELHIQHWPERSNSAKLRELLVEAEQLRLRLPSGDCIIDPDSRRPLLLVAAGTGFAQMKAIVESALAEDPERHVELWWAAKERRDFYLERLPREWAAAYPHVHFHGVSEAGVAADFDDERVSGHRGRVDEVLAQRLADVSAHDVYLSGSPGMVYACVDVLASLGLVPSRVFSDVFAYAPREPLVPTVGSLVKERRA
ncbi:NAD(P)H-flavin reductase [Halomonas caseinilytica]|uniref:CDP-4-dehydro-6-deoxyglucose reductase n=1 Tax=Halomonas caseinilytica TaxID=438744 RepID=A0A1M6QVY9_9GAMM|nr:NAD(P)H-flavin reductase [Halomonas caseinilytica]SEM01624.1 CDP-4-dehydro-6-deoxyglucose reductase [Halomonas caseinilytica]SHK24432.1 CDP-4-dehydro-6-deoxyglucose reductase [Halomonas caseinilytica]